MRNKRRPIQTDNHNQDKPHSEPQVATLIYPGYMERLDEGAKAFMASYFGSQLFKDFCEHNKQKSLEGIAGLNPGMYSEKDFYKISGDLRLVWRFWTDLQNFAVEYKPNNR